MTSPSDHRSDDPPPDDDAEDRSLDTVPADQDPADDREAADPRPTGEG